MITFRVLRKEGRKERNSAKEPQEGTFPPAGILARKSQWEQNQRTKDLGNRIHSSHHVWNPHDTLVVSGLVVHVQYFFQFPLWAREITVGKPDRSGGILGAPGSADVKPQWGVTCTPRKKGKAVSSVCCVAGEGTGLKESFGNRLLQVRGCLRNKLTFRMGTGREPNGTMSRKSA